MASLNLLPRPPRKKPQCPAPPPTLPTNGGPSISYHRPRLSLLSTRYFPRPQGASEFVNSHFRV